MLQVQHGVAGIRQASCQGCGKPNQLNLSKNKNWCSDYHSTVAPQSRICGGLLSSLVQLASNPQLLSITRANCHLCLTTASTNGELVGNSADSQHQTVLLKHALLV